MYQILVLRLLLVIVMRLGYHSEGPETATAKLVSTTKNYIRKLEDNNSVYYYRE